MKTQPLSHYMCPATTILFVRPGATLLEGSRTASQPEGYNIDTEEFGW